MRNINAIDRKILSILKHDATTSKAEIGRKVGLAPSAIGERIRRLKETGVILGFETKINPASLGFRILAFISVTERKPTGKVKTGKVLTCVTGVEEVHKIAGKDCFLVKIRARDTDELNEILEREINPIPSISGTSTTIVLKTMKEDISFNLPHDNLEKLVSAGYGIA